MAMRLVTRYCRHEHVSAATTMSMSVPLLPLLVYRKSEGCFISQVFCLLELEYGRV